MKAVGFFQNHPLSHPEALVDVEVAEPEPGPDDLLVEVRAVSVNPVDTKVRMGGTVPPGAPRIAGWDAAGVVLSVGARVQGFAPGDEVFYAGAIDRQGSNAQRQAVDARIVGHKPASLSFADAAALPLTSITAWELLFDRLGVAPGGGAGQRLLVVGGAGGVGSMLVQIARRFTALTVIATASRPETVEWVTRLGAHHVVDHRRPLAEELARIGADGVHLVASLTQTEQHFPALVAALRPQGRLALIDDPKQPLDIRALKGKSLSLHWELMFTRPMYQTDDIAEQGRLLERVAQAIDDRRLVGTRTRHFGTLGAATLRQAHAWIESGQAIGKGVLDGLPG